MVQRVYCICGCIEIDQYPSVCVCFCADRSQQLTDDALVRTSGKRLLWKEVFYDEIVK